jgi:hypothetical protein
VTQTLDDFFSMENPPPPDQLWFDLRDMIQARHEATPRHQQVELGPSDVSHPCMRKMAFGMMQVPQSNPDYDPLPSIIGVATHTWLESAVNHANEVLGRERWIPESRVHVTEGLSGSSDVYDSDTQTVVDWKIPGATRFLKYIKDPGPLYKLQVQFYGLGFENAGLPVKRVAIAFIPRAGTLRKMHLWQADYDRQAALAGLRKRDAVIALINDLEIESNPERYHWIPAEPFDCLFCPWWNPQPRNAFQCQGDA